MTTYPNILDDAITLPPLSAIESIFIKTSTVPADDSLFGTIPSAGTLVFDSTGNTLYIRNTALNDWSIVGGSSTFFAASGDLTGSNTLQQVISLTGAVGVINIASTGNVITWNSATTSPTLTQANTSALNVSGQNITIQAQNAVGSGSIGGNLLLKSGTGTIRDGYVFVDAGNATKIIVTPTTTIFNNNLEVHGTGTSSVATDGYIRLPMGASLTSRNFNNTDNLRIFSITNLPYISGVNTLIIGSDEVDTSSKTFDNVLVIANHFLDFYVNDGAELALTQKFVNVTNDNNFAISGHNQAIYNYKLGDGYGVMYLGDATINPPNNPSQGIVLYSDTGVAKIRQPNGLNFPITPFGRIITDPDWYIDPITGDDGYSGTIISAPLKSWAGLLAKWGVGAILTPNFGTMNINILNNLLTSDPVGFPAKNRICIEDYLEININGQATTVRSGTVTAVTALNRSANQPWEITDSAMSGTWTDDIRSRVRIVGGANDGKAAWVAKDLGSKKARMSSFDIIPQNFSYEPPGSVSLGDNYVVEALTQVTGGAFETTGYGYVQFFNLDVTGVYTTFNSNDTYFGVIGCRMLGFYAYNNYYVFFQNSCNYLPSAGGATIWLQDSFGEIASGLICGDRYVRVGGGGAELHLSSDVIAQGILLIRAENGALLHMNSVGVFDMTDYIEIRSGAIFTTSTYYLMPTFPNVVEALYGSGNAINCVQISNGSRFSYENNVPTITGASDFRLGGASTGRYFDETTGTWSAPIALTWANLGAAQPAGFGGNAVNNVDGSRAGNN